MAGEKPNPKIKQDPKEAEVVQEKPEKVFTLTAEDLEKVVSAAVQGALAGQPKQTGGPKDPDGQQLSMRLQNQVNTRLKEAAKFNQQLYNSKQRREIVIDEIYAEYAGKHITSTINGNTIKVPVDGQPYLVHPAHYRAIRERLSHISKQRKRNANTNDLFGNDVGDFEKV
jgi:hypothetical protein